MLPQYTFKNFLNSEILSFMEKKKNEPIYSNIKKLINRRNVTEIHSICKAIISNKLK